MAYIKEIKGRFYCYYKDFSKDPNGTVLSSRPCGERRDAAEEIKTEMTALEYRKLSGLQEADADGMKVSELFQSYVEFCEAKIKKGKLSAATLRITRRSMEVWPKEHLSRSIQSITEADASNWEDALDDEYAPPTKYMYIRHMKTVWNWAAKKRMLAQSPFCNMTIPVDKKDYARLLTEEEITAILTLGCNAEEADLQDDYVRARTDLREMFHAAIYFGMRPQRLFDLHINQYTPVNKTLFIPAMKGGKNVYLPVMPEVEYIFKGKTGLLWPGWDIGRLNHMWVRCKKRAKIVGRLRWYDLRHNCARTLLLNGWTLSEIQEWLGHTSSKTTEKYARYAATHLVDRMKQRQTQILPDSSLKAVKEARLSIAK